MSGFFGLLFWWVNTGAGPTAIPPVCVRGLHVVGPRVTFAAPVFARVTFGALPVALRMGAPEAC